VGEGQARHGDSVLKAGRRRFKLERLHGDGGNEHAVECETLPGEAREGNVPVVGRVKASAEKGNSHGAFIMLERHMRYTAYIGLGSNLTSSAGTPGETVQAAIDALAALGRVAAQSSVYRTTPVGSREQPYFINAVACLETELEPEDLLREMLAIERRFGRERNKSIPKGPRTLDLDLLLMTNNKGEAVVLNSAALTLPHPEISNRRFVMQPLAEIAPELRHPVLRKSMWQLLAELLVQEQNTDEEVTRL
jgi:2-amino-4-hydroxy-6-hydroxymethyldihydropteridine diphosphokinase